jgi:hypothetical protein
VALKRRAAEEEEERAKARLAARERVMKDFEKNQVGLGVSFNGAVGGSKDAKAQSQLTSTIDQDGKSVRPSPSPPCRWPWTSRAHLNTLGPS